MSDALWSWTATSLASAIREKKLSSREVIQAHLDRIKAVNGTVNAITRVLADEALAAADTADAAIASGAKIGPLHGVPITVKENIDVAGTATTHGVVGLKGSMARADAPVVRHLKQAGAIVIGRTNMPDFGLRWHTDNDLHGATLNPWDPSVTPGGSSGGEAAALATGMSPLGIGNDMGGSTRQPAVNCGVMGLRPSLGRVSHTRSSIFDDPPLFYDQVACVNGPMARSVGDLRLALTVMSRPDSADPLWVPAVAPPAPKAASLRVGLIADAAGAGVAPSVLQAVRQSAKALEEAGYQVEEIVPPLMQEVGDTIEGLADSEIASYLDEILPMVSRDAAGILSVLARAEEPSLARYQSAIAQRHRIAAAWTSLLADFSLVLGPVSTMEAFKVGYDTGGAEVMERLIGSLWLTELCNLLGLPSVALPILAENGLPQGVQIIGRRFDEERCFQAAEAITCRLVVPTPIDPVSSEE